MSPSLVWTHCQFSLQPAARFCVCTDPGALTENIRQLICGVAVDVGVPVCVAVRVTLAVGVSVGVAVLVGLAVAVGVGVEVGVTEGVGVRVAVGVTVGVRVTVGVEVGVAVTVGVGVRVGVAVGLAVGEAVLVTVAVGVRVAVSVAVGVAVGGGVKHTSTKTCVVRTSLPGATWCRTPACSELMSDHCHGWAVTGLVRYVVVPSVYVVVLTSGAPLKMVCDAPTLNCDVAELLPPPATERLTRCRFTDTIVSGRTAVSSTA